MPAASAIRAGRAYVELFADDSQLIRGLKSAQQRLLAFGKYVDVVGAGIAAAGAAITAPFLAAAQQFATAGDAVQKLGARTGIAAETLSQLGYAAGQSGSSLEGLGRGLKAMQKTITDGVANFGGLGISLEELRQLSPEQQFLVLADKISQIEDPTRRAALAMEFFGKSGVELLPLLNEGSSGITKLMREADSLGLTMSQEAAEGAAALGDAQDRLKKALGAVTFVIGGALAPALTDFFNLMAQAVAWGGQWVRENEELLRTIFMVGVALGVVGSAITALGATIAGAGVVLGGLATGLGVLGSVLGFIVSPVGIAIGLLGGLTAYALQSGAAVEWLTATFGPLGEFAVETFHAIKEALLSGDFQGAADVLMKTLQLSFTAGLNELEQLWMSFRDFLLDLWDDLKLNITNAWDDLQTTIAVGLVGLFTDDVGATYEAQEQLMSDLEQRRQGRQQSRTDSSTARQQAREEATNRLNAEIAATREAQRRSIAEVRQPRTLDGPAAPNLQGLDAEGLQELLARITQQGAVVAQKSISTAGTFSAEASRQLVSAQADKQLIKLSDISTGISDVRSLLEEVLSTA